MGDEAGLVNYFWKCLGASSHLSRPSGDLALDMDTDKYGLGLQLFVDLDDGSSLPPPPAGLHYERLEIDPSELVDPWTLIDRLAASGLSSLCIRDQSERGSSFTLTAQFCAPPDDLLVTRPSAIMLYVDDVLTTAFDRVGLVDLETEPYAPWRRYDRIDCEVAGDPTHPEQPLLWPERRDEDPFWELAGGNGERPLFTGASELSKWNPSRGYFAVFTSEYEATRALSVLEPHRVIDSRGRNKDSQRADLRASEIPSLRWWMKSTWAINQFRPTKVVVDTHLSRHHVGIADPSIGPYLRTTRGWWRIEEESRLELDHICHRHHELDSIHWDGSFGWVVGDPSTTFGSPEGSSLGEIRRLSRNERARARAAIWSRPARLPSNLADAFLMVTTDPVADCLVFRFFEDHLAALRWLREFEEKYQCVWSQTGRHFDAERFRSPSDTEQVRARRATFEITIERLANDIVDQDYTLDFARRLAAYINHLFADLRVEVCGYTTDVAYGLRERPFETGLLRSALGLDWEAVSKRLVSAGAYAVEPAAQRRCAVALGEIASELMSAEGRWFLAAALTHYEAEPGAANLDRAGTAIQMSRALEWELSLLFDAARRRFIKSSIADGDETPLGRFLQGGRPMTLGETLHYLRKTSSADSVNAEVFCRIVREIGAEVVFEKRWWTRLKSLAFNIRNKAAHTEAIIEQHASKCYGLVVGTYEEPGLLPSLVMSWKQQPAAIAPTDIGGKRSTKPDHFVVEFSEDELMDRSGDPGELYHSHQAVDRPATVDGQQLFVAIGDVLTLAKPPDGPLVLTTSAVARDGVLDVVQRIWSLERVQWISDALTRRVVRWSAQGDEIFSSGGDGLALRFKLDSGGACRVILSASERDEFRAAFEEAARGRYGSVATRASTAESLLGDIVEKHWTLLQRERHERTREEGDAD